MNEPTISAVLGAIVVLTIGVLLVNYFKDRGPAPSLSPATQTENTAVALPTTHKVAQGEHLWKIAEQYYKSGYNWVDIAQANNLTNADSLATDQELTIPSVQAKVATVEEGQQLAQAPPTDTTVQNQDSTQTISGESYKVGKGDHLWNIAVRAYGDGYKWPEIARANNLANPNLIYPDQELKLPR